VCDRPGGTTPAPAEIVVAAPAGTWNVLLDAMDVAERQLRTPAWKRHDPKTHGNDSCTGCAQEVRRRAYQSLRDRVDRLLCDADGSRPALRLPAEQAQLLAASVDEAAEAVGRGINSHCPNWFDLCDDCEQEQRKTSAYDRARAVLTAQLT